MEKSSLNPKSRKLLARVFLFFGVGLIFAAGFLTGINYELGRHKLNLGEFWNAYSIIEDRYVGSIDKNKAVEGATKGLVESLEDPYSTYMSRDERNSLAEELSGEFEGIGARLEEKDGNIVVVAPISGTPAEKAGVKANDVILEIDGTSTENMNLDEAVSKIRGTTGTTVKLLIFRESEDKPVELSITRANITVPSVTWEMLSGNVAYMEISQFGDDTVVLAKRGFQEIAAKNPKAFVLDLRNNPGGYLNDVAPIAGAFITPSVVVTQKYRIGKTEDIRSTDLPVLPNTPLYILVNGGSASAAEILAGALQDYGRAKLIGSKTFGKGSVQDIIPLPRNAALRLTIAEWLTPKGRSINKVGIEPDVKVEGEKTETADPVLDKALELIGQ